MTPPQGVRRRAQGSKVKTGCRTCKFRKLKCDEGKPSCLRCTKYGVECDGYGKLDIQQSSKPKQIISKANRPLAPLIQQLHLVASPSKGQEENQYFHYFQENTAFELSGGFDSPLWNRVVLQASRVEPSIHKLILSVAALSKAGKLSNKESATHENQYALNEYGKSLQGVKRLSTSKSLDGTRNVLLASILIYCFERMQGNVETAVQHLKTAFTMVWKARNLPGLLTHRHFAPSSPTQDFEEDLMDAFARLNSSVASLALSQSPKSDPVMVIKLDWDNESCNIPVRFFDTETARRYMEHMFYISRPNVSPQTTHPPQGLDKNEVLETPRRLVTSADVALWRSQLAAWSQAFRPLFALSRSPAGRRQYQAITTLHIQALACTLFVEAQWGLVLADSPPIRKASLERIAEICVEILTYSRELVEDERFSRGFVPDTGILGRLVRVAIICPDRKLGWEAVHILKLAVPRKESVYDALGAANMAEKILRLRDQQDAIRLQGVEGSSEVKALLVAMRDTQDPLCRPC